ncbi:MAG TPA: hypothetical protein PK586_09275 [Casimicrobium sp.]|nr:hypothetical protein [Casimicrobium sp.]HPV24474.1 hypothetical protein [Casimicrobium sp.]
MAAIRIFHIATLLLLAAYGALAFHRPVLGSAVYWVFWLAYAGLVFGAHRRHKWCMRLSITPPLLVFLFTAPNVAYNFWGFISGHPRYQDSPGTIIIVGIMAVCLTLPSALVLGAYWLNRRQVFGGA